MAVKRAVEKNACFVQKSLAFKSQHRKSESSSYLKEFFALFKNKIKCNTLLELTGFFKVLPLVSGFNQKGKNRGDKNVEVHDCICCHSHIWCKVFLLEMDVWNWMFTTVSPLPVSRAPLLETDMKVQRGDWQKGRSCSKLENMHTEQVRREDSYEKHTLFFWWGWNT